MSRRRRRRRPRRGPRPSGFLSRPRETKRKPEESRAIVLQTSRRVKLVRWDSRQSNRTGQIAVRSASDSRRVFEMEGWRTMADLMVTRVLPNPLGKDRTRLHGATNEQLNNEWVEFANAANHSLNMDGVSISHDTFDGYCQRTGDDRLMTFNGVLAVGSAVRVHTGSGTAWNEGPIRHLYAGRGNYAWNNRCGDRAVIRVANGDTIDWAAYEPEPPEGVVLNRVPGTNRLIPSALGATGTYGGR